MDYKESYFELLEANRRQEKELEQLRSKSFEKSEFVNETIFRIFHSAAYMMAISKLDTGQYVDVNDTFCTILGYTKEEIIGHTSDDIQIFADIEDSNKYIKLIAKLKSIKGYPVTLKTKTGKEKQYLFSADTVQLGDEIYLLTIFSDIKSIKDRKIKDTHGSLLEEIFETVSSYLALFSVDNDNRFYIIDLNRKVEEVELIKKKEVIGKFLDETPLIERTRLLELLNHLHLTGEPQKIAASDDGDDSQGYYVGFLLSSGNFVVTWEPGIYLRTKDDLHRQGVIFEKFADLLPEMVYEVDLTGKVLYANSRALKFFGFTQEDVEKGVLISDVFP